MKRSTAVPLPSHAVDIARHLTAAEVAARFGCSARKIKQEAARFGIGMNLRGRAGWRFSEADVEKLRRALTPPPAVEGRRSA